MKKENLNMRKNRGLNDLPLESYINWKAIFFFSETQDIMKRFLNQRIVSLPSSQKDANAKKPIAGQISQKSLNKK